MNNDPTAHDFDWISARRACSYGCEFEELFLMVEGYVQKQMGAANWKVCHRKQALDKRGVVVGPSTPGTLDDDVPEKHIWFAVGDNAIEVFNEHSNPRPSGKVDAQDHTASQTPRSTPARCARSLRRRQGVRGQSVRTEPGKELMEPAILSCGRVSGRSVRRITFGAKRGKK